MLFVYCQRKCVAGTKQHLMHFKAPCCFLEHTSFTFQWGMVVLSKESVHSLEIFLHRNVQKKAFKHSLSV